jgi:hypothetical protein
VETNGGKIRVRAEQGAYSVWVDWHARAVSIAEIKEALRGLLGDSLPRLLDEGQIKQTLSRGGDYKVRILPPSRKPAESTDLNEWPPYLTGWVVPTEIDEEGRFLKATVRCPCGNPNLVLLFRGGTNPLPCILNLPGPDGESTWHFVIAATCPNCGGEQVLFDQNVHGWEGALAGGPTAAGPGLPPLQRWRCLSCPGEPHQITVGLVREHILDFLERAPEASEEEYRNRFTWIAIDIRCCECGSETSRWVDYECR